jgi:mannan endo-1,4-beta-mannosidase
MARLRLIPLLLLAMTGIAPALRGQNYRFEAEQGTLSGVNVASSNPGYSGTGFVTGFDNDADKLTIQANVPAGLYELWVRYQSPYGWKGYGVQVGAERGNGGFDSTSGASQYKLDRAGVFELNGGPTSLQIQKDWGYYNVDYLELRPTTITPTLPVAPTLSDPQATERTKFLMNYLTSVYGEKTLAAQQGYVGSDNPFPSTTYLSASGGLVPAIRGSDFMDYSPSRLEHGANPNGETERIISWAKQTGGIPTMMWHWNAPSGLIDTPGHEWWRGFYSDSTTFNVQTALANPGSNEYNLLLRDIDAIGNELRKFQDAGVPVIWRPLHEAQGSGGNTWFWWGAEGSQPFVDLWRLMYDRLTNVDGLHNLIWVYTSTPANEDFQAWYPGDDVVDIIGADVYTDKTSSMSGQWYDLLDQYNGKKMITLSETGTLPDPSLIDSRGIHWSWFMPWQVDGSPLGVTTNYTPAEIQHVLGHDDVITLNELPLMPWKTVTGDINGDGAADGADFLLWQQQVGAAGGSADIFKDGVVDWFDMAIWQSSFGHSISGGQTPVPEPAALALSWMALGLLTRVSRKRLVKSDYSIHPAVR